MDCSRELQLYSAQHETALSCGTRPDCSLSLKILFRLAILDETPEKGREKA
jgi:hypothetical protein